MGRATAAAVVPLVALALWGVSWVHAAPPSSDPVATRPAAGPVINVPADWDLQYAQECLYRYSQKFAEGYLAESTVHRGPRSVTIVWRARKPEAEGPRADSPQLSVPSATGAVIEMSLGQPLPKRTAPLPEDVSEVAEQVTLKPMGKTMTWRATVGRGVDKQIKAKLIDPVNWVAQAATMDRYRRDTPSRHPDRPPVTQAFADVAPEGLIPYITGQRTWKLDAEYGYVGRCHDLPCAWFMWKTRLSEMSGARQYRERLALRRKLAEAVNARLEQIAADPNRSLHDSHYLVKSLAVTGASDLVFKRITALRSTDCCYAPALIRAAVACRDLWLAEALIGLLPHASKDGPIRIHEALRALMARCGPRPDRERTTTPKEMLGRWQRWWTWRPGKDLLSRDEIIDKARTGAGGEPIISAIYIPVARVRVQKQNPPPGNRQKVYAESFQMESVWVLRYARGPGCQQPERIRVFDARTGDDVDETVISAEPLKVKG